MAEMNARQQRAFNDALDFALMNGLYEVKELKIEGNEYNKDVHVMLEVGTPNDEGTLAEAICRSCYCFNIGARGGMYVYSRSRDCRREYIKRYDLYTKADIYRR